MDTTAKEVETLPTGVASSTEEARKYLKTVYPDIIYHKEKDVFIYRGREFNYFLSGYCLPSGKGMNQYMLVDPVTGWWLFTYDDREERWRDFLKHTNPEPEKSLTWFDVIKLCIITAGVVILFAAVVTATKVVIDIVAK